MRKRNESHLVDPHALSPIGNAFMGIGSRIERRSEEIWQQIASQATDLPEIRVVINARKTSYRYRKQPTLSTMSAIQEGIARTMRGIEAQNAPIADLVVMINSEWPDWHKDSLVEAVTDYAAYNVRLLEVSKKINHAAAHNKSLAALETAAGLVYMTEAGAQLASRRAFYAGALALGNNDSNEQNHSWVAVQGPRLAHHDHSGLLEATFYNVATLHPAFIGHAPRSARVGMGYASVDRTMFRLDELMNSDESHFGRPFNELPEAFPNGGFDSYWAELRKADFQAKSIGSGTISKSPVLLDWALATTHSEGVGAKDMIRMVRKDWPERGIPGMPYIEPTI